MPLHRDHVRQNDSLITGPKFQELNCSLDDPQTDEYHVLDPRTWPSCLQKPLIESERHMADRASSIRWDR
jgi:hypothetical protein